MKILCLTNIILPFISNHIKIKQNPYGGWLSGYLDGLLKNNEIEMMCVFPSEELFNGTVNNVSYASFIKNSKKNMKKRFSLIVKEYQPDIIHIFGTEFSHSLYMVEVCKQLGLLKNTIISIQGLISKCSLHYYAFLPFSVIHSITLRDFIKLDNIYLASKKFKRRGYNEIKVLKMVENVIGRTDWDKSCALNINPYLKYHFCNENLRNSFYKNKWNYEQCEKYSIFVSQSNYPIKGFHLMIEAFSIIKRKYPQAKLYTTGKNIFNGSIREKLLENSYTKFIKKIIKKHNLKDSIYFIGLLDEQEMCDIYLKANVFVSPSAIENSPNSVGEAMLLGVPTISSDVGGVKNMLVHEKEGYIYPADEPYMIAYYVDLIFSNQHIANNLSLNAINHAKITHSKEINSNNLINIYEKVYKEAGNNI